MGGFAWVTLATNDSYSLGALVLAHSLKAVGTAHQLAVLVTPGVTNAMREKLASVFNLVQEVNILDSRDEANLRLLKRPELGITFTKLHCWRLTQYDKCVFLDADTLVLQHCDELFERDELSAAPDVGWPDCFNSGVFVYRPSLDTYEKLIQFALEKGSFDGGDQGLLNLYFSDWAHKDISKHLPFIYNMCSTACYSYLPAFKQFGANAKIVHFIGAQKPWLQYFNTETRRVQPSGDSAHLQEVLQRWWDIFCSLIHPHLSPAMPQGQLQHGVSPSYFPPQYAPSPNPISSADDYESAWDPWDEYDQKIAQSSHYTSGSTHLNPNQPIESLNTNASHVAYQSTIHSQPQSHAFSTYSTQNNSFHQPFQPAYQHIPRVPTPPPSSSPQNLHPQHHHQQPSQHQQPPPHNHHHPPQTQRKESSTIQSQQQHYQPKHHETDTQHHYIEHHHSEHHQNHIEHSQPPPNQDSNFIFPERQDHNQYSEPFHQQNHSHPPPMHAQSFSQISDRPRSPNRPDPFPILPKECEATITVSNDMSLSSTIEDSVKNDDAGLAGAFAQLTLGVPRTAEQDALENLLRKQAWEVGNIDYLGKDSFDNIWSKITETLSAAPPAPLPVASAPVKEPELPAPAQSQSQTAPQEEAKPIELSHTPIDTSSDKSLSTDISQKTSAEAPRESPNLSSISAEKDLSKSTLSKPAEKAEEVSKVETETTSIVQESIPKASDMAEVPLDVCQMSQKSDDKKEEIKPQSDIPEDPKERAIELETQACPETECAIPKSDASKTGPVCQLTDQKKTPKECESPAEQIKESSAEPSKKDSDDLIPSQQQETSKTASVTTPTTLKSTSQGQETKTAALQSQEVTEKAESVPPVSKMTETKQCTAVTQQPAAEIQTSKPVSDKVVSSDSLAAESTEQVKTSVNLKEDVKSLPEEISKSPVKVPEKVSKSSEESIKVPEEASKALEESSKAPVKAAETSKSPKAPEEVPKLTTKLPQSVPETIGEAQKVTETATQLATKVAEEVSKVSKKTEPIVTSALPTEAPKSKIIEATKATELPTKVSEEVSKVPKRTEPIARSVVPTDADKSKVTGATTAAELATKVSEEVFKAPKKPETTTPSVVSTDAPKTKVTEATPPATPGSPLVEKTKEALDSKASIPETPPPTEGTSTPTPPPRKTDKPKKTAAKSKK